MYRTALRLTIAENRKDIAHWSSKLLLSDCKLRDEIIREQIDDMKAENLKLNERLENDNGQYAVSY